MPSETQSQEPRDRGPPPPVTRAGRSAQLAKAVATSPAPERRTRGRPRKDGRTVQSAPPSPPPPPPPPRNRKKQVVSVHRGRSRSRAQVEDEVDMDTTEERATHRTDLQEVKETAGRRRSTFRRKSNTNPGPGLDVDPEPATPHADPSPEPFPGAEVGHGPGSPAPPVSSGEVDPTRTTSPPPPSSSDLSSVQGGCGSPAHMEAESGPSKVLVEGGAASPSEQSSPYSAPFSPPPSPCCRLEDEDSLSPLPSLSEEEGASPMASLGRTQDRLKKQCAFCYRGDDLSLGQGHLVVFGPTPGYIPLHVLNCRASPDRDDDCHDHCYRGDQAPPTCSSPEQADQSSSEFIKQFGPIGLPLDVNVQSLFDPTGQCCAHLQCAAWSEGVCQGEGQSLLYVDKAIDTGSTQVCSFCCRLGATLHCQETGCGRSYHFICAAAAGAHQDWNLRRTHCTRHTHRGLSRCVSCSGGGDVGGLLMCCCCGDCYHGSCLDPPLVPSPLCRAGWQCPKCRVCQSCRLQGDGSQLLVCERCDKVYHSQCLTPPLDHTPSTGWTCKVCRVCQHCGVMSSGQWANHVSLCEACDLGLPCPECGGAPDRSRPDQNHTCSRCYRSVHTECLEQAGWTWIGSGGYVCSSCRTPTLDPPSPTKTTCALSFHPGPPEPQSPQSPAVETPHSPLPQSPGPPNPELPQSLTPPQSRPSDIPESPGPADQHSDCAAPVELSQSPGPLEPPRAPIQPV